MAQYNSHQQQPQYGNGYPPGAAAAAQHRQPYDNPYADQQRGHPMGANHYEGRPPQQQRAQTMTAQTMDRMQHGHYQQQNGYGSPGMPMTHQQQQSQLHAFPQPSRAPTMPPLRTAQTQYAGQNQQFPQQFPIRGQSRPQGPQAQPQSPATQNRYYSGGNQAAAAAATAAADPHQRAQTMSTTRPPQFNQPSMGYNVAPAQAFRQQQYSHASRTQTAQGRVVPERHDDRNMSMSPGGREEQAHQTMNGRVIPSRKRESNDTIDNRSSQGSVPVSPVTSRSRTISQSSTQPSRTFSMASTVNGTPSSATPQTSVIMTAQRRTPLVYPALLSRVAAKFQENVPVVDQSKDGLDYKSAFTGEDAVTTIAYIIKTTDRNLALLLGRSLDAQKFFHDVTYAHRLRDLRTELYQFREPLVEETAEVNGVFTLLTECYSPTCTRENLCYSIACPRRLEQQARLKIKPNAGLKRAESNASLHDEVQGEHTLWSASVSKDVLESAGEREIKRQEVIFELAYTERDFVKDLEYMRDFWIGPLRNPRESPLPEHKKDKFIKSVFSNISEVYAVNSKLAEAITKRQQERPIVSHVGDIFLERVPHFAPFINYGATQLFGKHSFEAEKKDNPAFARFVEDTERLKESRKLELNGYLTKPTTRLARYPLLLENIAKYSADDSPDKKDIPKAIAMIKEVLGKVNAASGKAENQFTLLSLNKELNWRQVGFVDLRLTEENRQLIFKGMLKRNPADQQGDIAAYLFDHAVLLVRVKTINKKEDLKVFRKPIPLELLVVAEMNEIMPKGSMIKRPSSGLTSGLMPGRTMTMTSQSSKDSSKQGLPVTFKHLGKGGYEITLYCTTPIQQQKWMELIDQQQRNLREQSDIFTKTTLNEGFFNAQNRVTSCVPIDGGRKLVLGTESGVYVCDRASKDASIKPKRVLDLKAVTSIEVLEQHSIFLVLADKTVYSFSMEALENDDGRTDISKRGRKICHANFFKAGVCQGKQLVGCVKTTTMSTVCKVYEPMDSMAKKSKKTGIAKMLASSQDVLKPIKEFYIPQESSNLHFLRSKLCVGLSQRGFEVVHLETLEAQSLLDQADTALDFVQQRRETIKPIHIERLGTEFLLCYTEFSFFVNRNGWRAKPDWMITWEGTPQAFAIFNPYILAFEPNFIEIRHMDSGRLLHILTANKIRMLHSSSREILYAYEDETGDDVIASLDFWSRPVSPMPPPQHAQMQQQQQQQHHPQQHPHGHNLQQPQHHPQAAYRHPAMGGR